MRRTLFGNELGDLKSNGCPTMPALERMLGVEGVGEVPQFLRNPARQPCLQARPEVP